MDRATAKDRTLSRALFDVTMEAWADEYDGPRTAEALVTWLSRYASDVMRARNEERAALERERAAADLAARDRDAALRQHRESIRQLALLRAAGSSQAVENLCIERGHTIHAIRTLLEGAK